LGIVNADGLATTAELLTLMARKRLAALVRTGALVRVWHGVYALASRTR
jgi:predicted transcriptional regulator of viral defense system